MVVLGAFAGLGACVVQEIWGVYNPLNYVVVLGCTTALVGMALWFRHEFHR